MTNCLFAHGLIAVAAEVTIRFFRPVATSRTATIRAWLDDSTLTLRRLGAELRQDGEIMTKTAGKFEEWYAPPRRRKTPEGWLDPGRARWRANRSGPRCGKGGGS
jgi:hypothetical protein